MTEQDLQNFGWNDISILRNPDNSLLIILLFRTQAEADRAAIEVIGKHPFRLNISRTPQGRHNFDLEFLNTEFGIRIESQLTRESYPPLTWIDEPVPNFLTTGTKTNDGKITRFAAMLEIDNILVK